MKSECVTKEEREYNRGYRAGFLDGVAAGRRRKVQLPDILQQPVEALGLPVRPLNCLRACGCQRVTDVTALSEQDIWRMRGLGKTSADQIARALHRHKIFGTAWDDFVL